MSKTLIQIVLTLMVTSWVVAQEIPIAKQVELDIPIGQFIIIDFPFKLVDKPMTTSFIAKKDMNKLPVKQEQSAIDLSKTKNEPQNAQSSANNPIDIQMGQNNLTFFAKREGRIELVVWGYEHPIMLTLNIDGDKGSKYYGFYEPNRPDKHAQAFESGSHEKILARLLKSLHLESVPAGYKNYASGRKYTLNNIEFIHANSFIGNRYAGETWFLENKTKQQINLYSEMFYSNQDGIYLVALENEQLLPNEKTRLFLIRDATKATSLSE